MKEFYQQMLATCEQAGLKVLSDDKCCRLLAWLYVHGGGREETVVNTKLTTDIMEAQKRLNLYGGECCNAKILPKLQEYIREAENSNPEWVEQLCNYYGLITTKI